MDYKYQRLRHRLERERKARKEAEKLLEEKSLMLYKANEKLIDWTEKLEIEIKKRTEQLRLARDNALKANLAKSSFLTNMSHEIRTPMSGVIGMTELILDTSLSDEQKHLVDIIHNSSKSVLNIINDILDLSKLETGKLDLNPSDFDIFQLIDDVIDTVSIQAVNKRLEMNLIVDQSLPRRLHSDPIRLRQILLNLVGNAIKFTQQGKVIIELKIFDNTPSKITMQFRITDTGAGIKQEDLEKLFSKFTQLDDRSVRQNLGTGLGLAISKELVELFPDGEIGCSSKLGQGSIFWFTISVEPVDSGVTSINLYKGLRAACLITDNGLQKTLESILGCLGVEIDFFTDCPDLITALKQNQKQPEPYRLLLVENSKQNEFADLLDIKPGKDSDLLQAIPTKALLLWGQTAHPQKHRNWDQSLSSPITWKKLETLLKKSDTDKTIAIAPLFGQNQPFKRPNILLVEDNKALQMIAKAYLTKCGCQVDIANNGVECIQAVKNNDYDLILMDIQMPVMDGVIATRSIRNMENPSKANLPIIALTANAMKTDLSQYLKAGMNDYLIKPIDQELLVTVLRNWLPFN